MIPDIEILTQNITETTYPNRTYKIVFNDDELGRVSGYADELDSVTQAIYLILSTERYKFLIYSWDYGIELLDLIGKPLNYILSELPRRITEALLTDDRIKEVKDFEFEKTKNQLHTTFTVVTDVGNISTALEVVV